MPLRVAICGDSAMWGQGLLREHTYAHLAATRIAESIGQALEVLPGRSPFEPERGEARSGAKIRPKQDKDAEAFIDAFPLLFESDTEKLDLEFARDESPGALLFGENPATFPTVSDAVRHLGDNGGTPVGLVLIDGGINDIDFEEVLDPEGADMSKIIKELRHIFGNSLNQLLRETRTAFPQAVIVVVGYFSALSDKSDKDELETLFKYLADKPEWQVSLNDLVQDVIILRDITNSIGLTKDVDSLIRKAVRRSVAAAAQAHFWTRRTIAGLPDSVIGPGILYAHPSFRPQHALFAAQSLLHEGYRQPGDGPIRLPEAFGGELVGGQEVADEMLATRLEGDNIPRRRLLRDYRRILGQATSLLFGGSLESISADLGSLLAETDLPTKLRSSARDIVDREDRGKLKDLIAALSREIGRIEIATIASFIHPNEAGASRYADRIVSAYNDHQRYSIRSAVGSMRVAGEREVQLGAATKKHGLDSSKGIRRLATFARIESVAVQFEELSSGLHPISLSLGGAKVECLVTQSGSNRQFLAFDMPLALGDLTEISLTPLIASKTIAGIGGLPKFDKLTVFLNAREFMSLRADQGRKAGDTLILWAA